MPQARNNALAVEDMDGGTFTISNGGVFGSMFGTPIINPPQSAILGMHGIFDRPVAINGKVRVYESARYTVVGEIVSVFPKKTIKEAITVWFIKQWRVTFVYLTDLAKVFCSVNVSVRGISQPNLQQKVRSDPMAPGQ